MREYMVFDFNAGEFVTVSSLSTLDALMAVQSDRYPGIAADYDSMMTPNGERHYTRVVSCHDGTVLLAISRQVA